MQDFETVLFQNIGDGSVNFVDIVQVLEPKCSTKVEKIVEK